MVSDEEHQFIFWNITSATPEMTYSSDIKGRMEFWDQIYTKTNGSSGKVSSVLPWLLAETVVWMFSIDW